MNSRHPVRRLSLCVLGLLVSCTDISKKSDCARGTVGIEVTGISREYRETLGAARDLRGAVVTSALLDGPAGLAGVRKDDVLIEISGVPVTNSCDAEAALSNLSCDPVSVVVWRNGSRNQIVLQPEPEQKFLDEKCRSGAQAACFRQAWLLWNGKGVEADQSGALGTYRLACEKGWPEACAYLGAHLQSLSAIPGDVLPVLQRACDLGSGSGCAHLAYLYATGTLVERDDAHATPLYVRSCDLGDGLGCYNAALMYNDARGVERDVARAVAYDDEGCRAGSSAACTDLGWFYQSGTGVANDEKRAAELYALGCAGTRCQAPNRRGCVNLAIMYRDGTGVAAEPSRAATILRTACEDDVTTSDPGAQDSRSHACALLGAMYLEGQGVPFDYDLARSYSERGCRGQNRVGCFNSAIIFSNGYGVETDMAQAAKFFALSCNIGDGEACYELSRLYSKGSGVEENAARARELARKACESGFDEACGSR